ncbi:Uncharacterised protein [Shigella sonnei]|nr:Uncharacterised protein [Shigella sonnei]
MPGSRNRNSYVMRQLREHAHNAKFGHPQTKRAQSQR